MSCLYTSNPMSYKQRIAPRVDGTCTWFLKNAKFVDWLKTDTSSLIWVSGDPGCGKTVLSSFLIDKVKQLIPSATVCFFFCDDKIDSQKDATALLRGILHQLLDDRRILINHAMSHFETKKEKIADELSVLWEIWMACCADPKSGNIVCIIDALDECEALGRTQLLQWIIQYFERTSKVPRGNFLKLLLTSRPDIRITDIMDIPNVRLKVEDEIENIRGDVELVVKERVSKVASQTGCSEDTKEWLERRLVSNADRTFLWISLVLDMLQESAEASQKAFEERLRGLPDGLNDTYTQILEHVRQRDRHKAKIMLQIIVTARRPLTLNELNIAWAIRPQHKSKNEVEHSLEPNIARTVRGLCGLFVRIIDGKIYLVHQTAKEFLIPKANNVATDGMLPWHCVDPLQSSYVIAERCIWFLLLEDFKIKPLILWSRDEHGEFEKYVKLYTEQHDFLDYAAANWANHFREAEGLAEPTALKQVLELYDCNFGRFLTWSQVYWSSLGTYSRRFTPLHMSSYNGHRTIVRLLLEAKADVDAKDSFGRRTALHWAAENGHEAVVRLLLEVKADVDAKDIERGTALHRAALNGHEAVVRLLLEVKADVDAKDTGGKTVLHWAALNGHEAVVRLLLEAKADADAKDTGGKTALHRAAENGHEAVIRLLLISSRPPY
jgi:ankyrin repeat domain-containing protein 50